MKKKTIKKIATVTLAALSLSFVLTGCGGASDNKSTNKHETTIKLGVVGATYEDIWKPAQEALKKDGINLEIVQFSDYVTPNNALNSGDIDLNAFQHRIYLDTEVKQNHYKIEPIGYTFVFPLHLYSHKLKSLNELTDGAVVAIPDDPTNGGRALKVLQAAGLITLKADAGFSPTLDDIATYHKKIEIKELKANTIPSVLNDVDAGIVNGNYALDFGLKAKDALFKDNSLEEEKYWNLIVARSEDLKNKKDLYQKVLKAFQTPETEKVFNDTFDGYYIKAGWDQDLLK